MRVVGGRLRGRTLAVPRGGSTRPTPERVREALFSILGSVENERVLDLFAGSGALAIEALSRGAAAATFVDSSSAATAAIKRNLSSLAIDGEIRREPAGVFLQRARRDGRQYDLVLLDPPYRLAGGFGRKLARALAPVLAPGARVVAESDRRMPLELEPLARVDERRYGDTMIRIYSELSR